VGAFLFWLLVFLGFSARKEKLQLEAKPRIDHLGFHLDSGPWTVSVSKKRTDKLLGALRLFVSRAERGKRVSKLWAQSLAGQMTSTFFALPVARVFCRRLFAFVNDLQFQNSWALLPPDVIEDLNWWIVHVQASAGKPLALAPFSATLRSDASDSGWAQSSTATTASTGLCLSRSPGNRPRLVSCSLCWRRCGSCARSCVAALRSHSSTAKRRWAR
jgi:hypothetical protein